MSHYFRCVVPAIIWMKNHSCMLGQGKGNSSGPQGQRKLHQKKESPTVLCQEHRNSPCVFHFLLGMHISLTIVEEADVSKDVFPVNDPSISDSLQR